MVHGAQHMVFPKDPVIRFTKIKNQLKAPFIVYECSLVPGNDYDPAHINPVQKMNDNEETTPQSEYQKHVPCSFAY